MAALVLAAMPAAVWKRVSAAATSTPAPALHPRLRGRKMDLNIEVLLSGVGHRVGGDSGQPVTIKLHPSRYLHALLLVAGL